MAGRGRGEGANVEMMEIEQLANTRYASQTGRSTGLPMMDVDDENSSSSSSSGEKVIRGRGGFRCQELCTIPANLTSHNLSAARDLTHQPIQIIGNFVKIKPMEDRFIYAYRIDFEPDIESISLRQRMFRKAAKDILGEELVYDGVSDARSSSMTKEPRTELSIESPDDQSIKYKITLRRTGTITPGSYEMLRVYNMNMRKSLESLGFFRVGITGSYVHPSLATPIGRSHDLYVCRGYNTSANQYETGDIMMKLESCHKLMQSKNVLQNMQEIRQMGGNVIENVKAALTGKLVVTDYKKVVYRIEDVNFNLSPKSTFKTKSGETSYIDYFKARYNVQIKEPSQPLLLVVQNNRRSEQEKQGESRDIYVVPELCNIAGLTTAQQNDSRLKVDLIRSSQICPTDRVSHLNTLIQKLNTPIVHKLINRWGYSYDTKPVTFEGRILPMEKIGVGIDASNQSKWDRADPQGGFEMKVMKSSCAVLPELPRLAIILPNLGTRDRELVLSRLRQGMMKIGFDLSGRPRIFDLPDDSSQQYVLAIREIPPSVTIIIAVLKSQNKERYDAIKKLASVERGIVTQVVTVKLLADERKAGGASTKIGIQVAAKIGGEPWLIHIPLPGDMICGYDTYHDTANRGRSYGAFVASMNQNCSRWFSRADCHSCLDELSPHLAANLVESLKRFKRCNGDKPPTRVFIYRDGVSDGQIEQVYRQELKKVKKALKEVDANIKLTFIIVNKKTGAQFYLSRGKDYDNPPPGSVIDTTVTRKDRYDFYLISQSTRQGTVAPTYYNIIFDESGLDAAKHQILAFKLCFLYYNWAGTVRVPAPCQYAHKLAYLCGEHLHAIPNANLDDRLHFL